MRSMKPTRIGSDLTGLAGKFVDLLLSGQYIRIIECPNLEGSHGELGQSQRRSGVA